MTVFRSLSVVPEVIPAGSFHAKVVSTGSLKGGRMIKRLIALLLTISMILSILPLCISAASKTPSIYSHEDGDTLTVSPSEKIVIRFYKARNADHYWCRVKVLDNSPEPNNINETALDDCYDFIYDGITQNRINIYGYDLVGAEKHYMKVYIEARDKDGDFLANDTIYLYLRGDDFESPWKYGILPMKTAKKGNSSTEIKVMKQAINIILGEERLPLTKKFDTETKSALAEAQRLLGLEDDGIFGPASRRSFLLFLEQNGYGLQNKPYDVDAALAYAKKFNGAHPGTAYNPVYVDYAYKEADCANFVSQCLVAGGFAMRSDYYPEYTGWTWTSCSGLTAYLTSLGYKLYTKGGTGDTAVDINKIKPGDLIFSGNNSGHVMIVDHVQDNRVYYYGHTNDRCGCSSCNYSMLITGIQSHIALEG